MTSFECKAKKFDCQFHEDSKDSDNCCESDCEICKYLNFLEWASCVVDYDIPSTISTNSLIEKYLKLETAAKKIRFIEEGLALNLY